MSNEVLAEIRSLREQVAMLISSMLPHISTDEMCVRYKCTPKTLNNMERDGRIPFRKQGKWDRNGVMKWEVKSP